ncbi:hypothetical protein [Actinomadura rudentiformis]|uniref:Sulfotransferase family protein n=1 Tax=Actinomadura rudentiformis TaxID=359158 RepID=A0A6H9YRB6_9ACTN|nr:hypothetical protein [Actinomadura rudentiformis]KAB2347861.1 hypothetical protein F8566_18395 [Actinomadura rudentiformis]
MASTPPGGAPRPTRPVVYMHVGAAKSGTTYLQQVLWHNRHRLADAGVLYPGKDFAAHVRAAFDLRNTFFRGASDPTVKGAWGELVAEARDWPGTVIISQELFAPTRAAYVRRALADLDFADVHVVFTARDLGRQIPAHWQEDVKNRFTTSFDEFISSIRRQDWRSYEVARLFWGLQDPVAVLARWGADLPPERVHVVTLPRPGAPRDLLWQRFSAAVGISPDDCDLSGSFSNPSLGLAETQFLREINITLDENRVDWHVYNDEVKLFLAQEALIRRPSPIKIELPAEYLPWATERAIETVEDLRAAGYDVQGDLYDLIPMPSPAPAPAPHPDEPQWADMADVGADAIAALLQRIQAQEKRAARVPGAEIELREWIESLQRDTAALLEITGDMAHDASPLTRRAAQNVTERYPAVRQLRGAYQRIQAKAGRTKTDQAKTGGSAPQSNTRGTHR